VTRSLSIAAGSVTSQACPTAVTDQPVRVAGSYSSASNATTAPRIAAASLPLAEGGQEGRTSPYWSPKSLAARAAAWVRRSMPSSSNSPAGP
jgi:hypothetical protein